MTPHSTKTHQRCRMLTNNLLKDFCGYLQTYRQPTSRLTRALTPLTPDKQRTRRLEIRRERLRVTRLHLPKGPLLIPARWCHQRAQNRAGRWEPFERSVSSACALWTIRARYSRAKVVNRHRSRRHTPKAAEVHFSTRLLAHQRLASTRRGALDFTTPLHP